MRRLALLAALCLSVPTFAPTILTWDTNSIGSPVNVYTANFIGIGSGESFTLPNGLESGTMIIVAGQGTFVPVTNIITTTNAITLTNFTTTAITNTVTKTNLVTVTQTNAITLTNWMTITTTVTTTNTVNVTNVVRPKPPRR